MNKIDQQRQLKQAAMSRGSWSLSGVSESDKNQGAGAESILSRRIISRQ